jgi:hypothetical protein
MESNDSGTALRDNEPVFVSIHTELSLSMLECPKVLYSITYAVYLELYVDRMGACMGQVRSACIYKLY